MTHYMTAAEAATYLRLSRGYVLRLARLGWMKRYKPNPAANSQVWFLRADLDAYMSRGTSVTITECHESLEKGLT